ncbi:DNAH7 [Symbiodinium sp. CCMP2456]|nr:DNAH7 [Symbiodinium sp. CCMP2456]
MGLAFNWSPHGVFDARLHEVTNVVEQFNPDNVQTEPVWLTSMPARSFPVQVLQNGVKMTNEPPSGLRANLLRSHSAPECERSRLALSDELLRESNKPEIFKTLPFGFFHVVVQDRRMFGPMGWNNSYGFTPEDLQVCRKQLMLFINQHEQVIVEINCLSLSSVTLTMLQTFIRPEAVEQKYGYKYSASGFYYAPAAEKRCGR